MNIKEKYNLGGRPKAFESSEEMQSVMYAFLQDCEERQIQKFTKNGVLTANIPAPITIEGFCAYAGITKTTFYDYGKKKKYQKLVAQFRQIVESYWVNQCAEGNPGNKADFILKNAFSEDWKDKNVNEIDFAKDIKKAMVQFVSNEDNANNTGENSRDF